MYGRVSYNKKGGRARGIESLETGDRGNDEVGKC